MSLPNVLMLAFEIFEFELQIVNQMFQLLFEFFNYVGDCYICIK